MSQTSYKPPRDCGLDIIYCDDWLLVANKPAGLLSVPGRGPDKTDSLTSRVQKEFPDALSVHRLDMNTSGLQVFGRGKEMHRRLSCSFRERGVRKSYIAIVTGRVKNIIGEVDLPLSSDWPNRPRQKVDFAKGKPALTHYRLLASSVNPFGPAMHSCEHRFDTSLLELQPVTGRTHQLRIHMASIGHPILGDSLYGPEAVNGAKRMLLHARALIFAHPANNVRLALTCEPSF